MADDDFRAFFEGLARRFLSRTLSEADGFDEQDLAMAEGRLLVGIPEALRAYYRCSGRFSPFSAAYNTLRPPDELELDQGYLVYMDENQHVVSWGIARADLGTPDPVVWQRNNTPSQEWFSEDKTFTAFMLGMFEWYAEANLWNA